MENITLTKLHYKYLAKSISGKAAEEMHFAPIFEQHCLIVGKILKMQLQLKIRDTLIYESSINY